MPTTVGSKVKPKDVDSIDSFSDELPGMYIHVYMCVHVQSNREITDNSNKILGLEKYTVTPEKDENRYSNNS